MSYNCLKHIKSRHKIVTSSTEEQKLPNTFLKACLKNDICLSPAGPKGEGLTTLPAKGFPLTGDNHREGPSLLTHSHQRCWASGGPS